MLEFASKSNRDHITIKTETENIDKRQIKKDITNAIKNELEKKFKRIINRKVGLSSEK